MAEQGPLSGQTVGGKYVLGELLGEGGFGVVYKAYHHHLQRQQAIKILLERHFQKKEFRERFLREAQTVATLDHPNIIHTDDFWVEPSRAYLVMPFIKGGTFQDVLRKQQKFLELQQIVFYLEHICAALDYAHTNGVVHLDVKPLNLLVHDDGRLLLADFGLAHLMKQGVMAGGSSLLFGTPHYMAPEHIQGHPEQRSDLFSLGVLLYRMLVGRLPFEGLTPEAVMIKNLMEWPPAPRTLRQELPQEVEDVVARALAKQPEQRYQTASDFLSAFKKALLVSVQPLPLLHLKMPQLGESVAEGTIGSWLKNEGDWVEKGEKLVEIETDKVNVEVGSPVAGRLTKILVKADETFPVDADIAIIEESSGFSTNRGPGHHTEPGLALF